jgi:hypothetical protein
MYIGDDIGGNFEISESTEHGDQVIYIKGFSFSIEIGGINRGGLGRGRRLIQEFS